MEKILHFVYWKTTYCFIHIPKVENYKFEPNLKFVPINRIKISKTTAEIGLPIGTLNFCLNSLS